MLYTFECKNEKCEKFNKQEDRLVKMADADSQVCQCGEPMEHIDTFSTSLQFKGRWFKTTRSY